MKEIQLGDKVKDRVTGFIGIAVARTKWITGCDRIGVQPIGMNEKGEPFDSCAFDEPMLDIVKAVAVKPERAETKRKANAKTGGPMSHTQEKRVMQLKQ